MPFTCSICEEESTRICVQCTKDTCSNHLCDKCGRCSDCCDCEVPLDDMLHAETVHPEPVLAQPEASVPPTPDPKPEPPHPPPDPDPIPGEEPEPEPGPLVG